MAYYELCGITYPIAPAPIKTTTIPIVIPMTGAFLNASAPPEYITKPIKAINAANMSAAPPSAPAATTITNPMTYRMFLTRADHPSALVMNIHTTININRPAIRME